MSGVQRLVILGIPRLYLCSRVTTSRRVRKLLLLIAECQRFITRRLHYYSQGWWNWVGLEGVGAPAPQVARKAQSIERASAVAALVAALRG